MGNFVCGIICGIIIAWMVWGIFIWMEETE